MHCAYRVYSVDQCYRGEQQEERGDQTEYLYDEEA